MNLYIDFILILTSAGRYLFQLDFDLRIEDIRQQKNTIIISRERFERLNRWSQQPFITVLPRLIFLGSKSNIYPIIIIINYLLQFYHVPTDGKYFI